MEVRVIVLEIELVGIMENEEEMVEVTYAEEDFVLVLEIVCVFGREREPDDELVETLETVDELVSVPVKL